MAYTVRYQVFLSSTFTDLREERAEIIQALWELDCIPTGMEAFLASNESQWDIIRRVIDECDYYILIIGGRYGTITEGGISYTEREFRYAQSINLPILAFVHENPSEIPLGRSESDSAARQRLSEFRKTVTDKYPVRTWGSALELGGIVSRSLIKEIKSNTRPGWTRNDGQSPVDLLQRIDALNQENLALREKLDAVESSPALVEELESGSDKITFSGDATVVLDKKDTPLTWTASASWDDIFKDFGPELLNEASEERLRFLLSRFLSWDNSRTWDNLRFVSQDVHNESFGEVIVQFRALGLIQRGTKRRGVSDKHSYWALTSSGERYLVSLLAKRKAPKPAA